MATAQEILNYKPVSPGSLTQWWETLPFEQKIELGDKIGGPSTSYWKSKLERTNPSYIENKLNFAFENGILQQIKEEANLINSAKSDIQEGLQQGTLSETEQYGNSKEVEEAMRNINTFATDIPQISNLQAEPTQTEQQIDLQPGQQTAQQSPTDQITVSKDGSERSIQRSQLNGFLNNGYSVTSDPVQEQVETQQVAPGVEATMEQEGVFTGEIPSDIMNSQAYQMLSEDQKSLVNLYYASSQASSEEQKAKISLALDEAIKIADPHTKEQIRIVQDEMQRSIQGYEGDFQSKKTQTEDRIGQIQEDLTFNKENLTLEQQSDLAQQLRKYKSDLYGLQQSAAESGLAFSSPRTQAEEQLKTENQGYVESVNRAYNKSQRNLQVGSERNVRQLQQGAEDMERQRKEQLTDIQRQGEKTLGSKGAYGVEGVEKLGGLTGTLEHQRAGQVSNWVDTLTKNPLENYLK